MADQPARRPFAQTPDGEQGVDLGGRGDVVTECGSFPPQRLELEDPPGTQVGQREVLPGGAGLACETMQHGRTCPVEDAVRNAVGDDLSTERMVFDRDAEACTQRRGEVADGEPGDRCQIGGMTLDQLLRQTVLAHRQQHGELGRGETLTGEATLGQLLCVGKRFEVPRQQACGLELVDVPSVDVGHVGRLRGRRCSTPTSGCGCVPAPARPLRRSSRRAARCVLAGQFATRHRCIEQDLDVDLVIGAVDAGGVVDGVGEDPAAVAGELDPAPLGQTEVATLADDRGTQVASVDTDAVVGLVTDLEMRLLRALHVRADAAVPEQIDRRGTGSR